MRKSGNGDPKQCIENLVSIVRGEVPFDRVRGMDARIIDKPSAEARIDFAEDAQWNIETFEPRVDPNDTAVTILDGENGGFSLDIEIKERTEEDDE